MADIVDQSSFSQYPPWRLKVHSIVSHRYYDYGVFCLIAVNCATIAAVNFDTTVGLDGTFDLVNGILTFAFVFEMTLKVIGFGVKGFMRQPWNVFDLIVVIAGLIGFIVEIGTPSDVNSPYTRTIRILRLIRILSVSEKLRILVTALIASSRSLLHVVILMSFFILLVSDIALDFFKGSFQHRCHPIEYALEVVNGTRQIHVHNDEANDAPVCRYSALSDEYFHRANQFFSEDTSNATELQQFVDSATTKLIYDNNYDARFQRYGLDLGFIVRNKTELPFVNVASEDNEFMCRYGELCIIAQTPQYGKTNFDTVVSTVSLIYDLMSSLDGWTFIIYFLSMGQGWWVATLYFGFILTVGNFFLLNLTLVVILDAFDRSQTLTSMVEDAVLETTTQMEFTCQNDDAASSYKGSEPTTPGSPDSASGSPTYLHSYQKALLADPSPSPNLKQKQDEEFPLRRHQRARGVSFGAKYEDYVRSKVNDETSLGRKRANTTKSKGGFFSNQFQRQLSAAFGASHDIDNMNDGPSPRETEEEMSDAPAVPLAEGTSAGKSMFDIAKLEDSHEQRVRKSQDDELTAARNARTTFIEERDAEEETYQRPAVVGAYTLLSEYESDASNTERQSGRRGHIAKPSNSALTMENVMCCFPCCSTMMCPPLVGRIVALMLVTRRLVRNYLVARLWFRVLTGAMLVLNLAIESTAYAGMTQSHRDFIDGANIFFTLFYVIEVVSKLIAYPFFVFRRDMFNFFDLGVTLASAIELVTTNGGETFGALRSLRLLRLVSIIEPFRITMATLISAFRGAVSLLVLVFLFIFLFAVMGMQIFAGNYCGLDTGSPYRVNTTFCDDVPRYNFDNVGYAFQTIFSVVSSEGWRDMMVVAEASTSPYASLFFCIAHFTVGYLVLNLFVAVMLNSCTEVQMVSYALNAMMRRSEGTKDGRTRFFKIRKADMGLLDSEVTTKKKKRSNKTSSGSKKSKRSSQSGACSDAGVVVTDPAGLSALGGGATVIKRAMGSSADTNSPKWDNAVAVAGTERGITVARTEVPAFELASDEASAAHLRDDAIANDLFEDLARPKIKRRNDEGNEDLDEGELSTSDDFSSTGSHESEAGVFEDQGQAEEDVVREFMFSAVSRRNLNQAPKSRRWMKQDDENLDDHLLRTNANTDESPHLAGVSQRRVAEVSVARLTSNNSTEQPPVITRDSFPLFSRILLRLRESAAFVYTSPITLIVIIGTTLLSMAYQTVWSPVLHPYHPILVAGQAIDVVVAAVYLFQTAVKMLYFGFKTYDEDEEEVVVVSAPVPLYAPPTSEASASAPPKVDESIDEDAPVIEDFSPFIFPTKSYFNSHWHIFELIVTIAATIPLIVHSVWAHSITYNYRTSSLASSCSSCIIWCRLLRNLHVWTFVRYYPPANLLFRSLIRSIRGLRNAFTITILIWYIYAVLGLQLFGDKMSACTTNPHTLDAGADGNWGDASYAYPYIEDKATCISAGYFWRAKPQNFDNVGEALVTVFNIATVSNWHFTMYTATDSRGRGLSPKQNSTVWAPLYFMSVIVIIAYFLINFFKASLIEAFFSTKAAIEAKFLEIRGAREIAADVVRQRRLESLRVAKRRLAKLQQEDGDKVDFEWNIVNWDDGSGAATTQTLTKRQKVKRHLASKIKSIVTHLTESNVMDQTTIVNSKRSGEIRAALDAETAAAGNFVLMLTEDERYFFDMYKFALYFVRPPLVVEYTRNSSRTRFYLRTALRSKYADFSLFILAALHLFLELTQFWTTPIMSYPGYAKMDMAFTMVFIAIMIGKMIVYGISAYFDTTSNKLDCAVNILTLAGAIMGISHDDAYFWRSTRILLFFRFVRMHHILNVSRQLAVQLRMFVDSSQSFLSVFVLLFIYVFTAAHMAMNFFGRVKWTDFDGLNQWSTFSRFDRAMYTLVRIGTTDNWNHIMHNCQLEAPLCDPNIGECGNSVLSPFFFLIYLSFANWIGLNFFTAVLMEGFVKSDSDEKFPIQQDHVRHFQRQWKKLARRDPTHHTLTFNELLVFMCLLPAKPLGLSGPLKNFKGTIGVRRARCSIQEQIATTMAKENMPFGKLQQSAQKRAKDIGEDEGAVGSTGTATPQGSPTTGSSPGDLPTIHINTHDEEKEIQDENLLVGAVTVLRLLLNLTYVPLFLYGPGSPSSLPESEGVTLQTPTKKELHPNESNFVLGQYYCFPGDVFDGLARLHYGYKLPKVAEKVLLRERYKSFKREETEATMEYVSTVSHFSESSKPADEAAQKEFDAVVQRMRARHGDDKVMPGKNREFFVTSVAVMAACVLIQRCWRRHVKQSTADASK